MFGSQRDFDNRTAEYRSNLVGIKHLHRLKTPFANATRPQPNQLITLHVTTSGGIAYDAVRCWMNANGEETTFELLPGEPVWNTLEWRYVLQWHGQIPPQASGTVIRYKIGGRVAGSDNWIFADNQARVLSDATEFAISIDDYDLPTWARDAVIYHIFLDRFYPGDGMPWKKPTNLSGFFGGTLRGAIQKLDYIQSLGCNAIWLSPLFASPSHHGYDATDYYTVEPRFGTNADLKELIEEAHQRRIRVIFDLVANHWSNQHPTFQAAQRDENSEYRAWYTWQRWPDEYTSFFGVKGMPQLNLKHKPASDHLLACAQYWLENGVDGYRLDYAPGPPHTFWADFRQACKAVTPDVFLFGEVVRHSEGVAAYVPHFDGCLDFLLADALRRTFVLETLTLLEFEAFLAAHETYFPKDFSLPAFLDNHDMTRILYLAGEDKAKVKLAALVLFTLSAPPVIYNGTEVGVSQRNPLGRFEEARLPMLWGDEQDKNLLTYFRRLGTLRKQFSAITSGRREVVQLNVQNGTYAYLRTSETNFVLIVLNTSRRSETIDIPISVFQTAAEDMLNGNRVLVSENSVKVSLPAQSSAFIA
ncbi:alpha-amylase [Candidatus Poribacteria bacterium]|nr:alpha-amylase family glycosyl hydrolase [Candidatus Poribacteria bacterium]MYA68914.1 alpha-amylase [Candidatus Poribacteria bacterium]MYH80834.1 alpha-amylase [Candidatus Poribacteria bacterium]MYK95788.1 alpha-amylase [Candidatus Poribacteria bacterium]